MPKKTHANPKKSSRGADPTGPCRNSWQSADPLSDQILPAAAWWRNFSRLYVKRLRQTPNLDQAREPAAIPAPNEGELGSLAGNRAELPRQRVRHDPGRFVVIPNGAQPSLASFSFVSLVAFCEIRLRNSDSSFLPWTNTDRKSTRLNSSHR